MKKLAKFFSLLFLLSFIAYSCNKDEDVIPKDDPLSPDTGILKLSLTALTIEESNAKVQEVVTEDFIVKIFKVGESDPVFVFNPFSSAPDEVVLETGEYYVEAQNLDPPAAAAFEQPWYYGISENFTIDKEELKEITVLCTLANYKVAFSYSANVVENFTTWNAKATQMIPGELLEWPKDDNREGFFLTGEALSIEVHLEYQKAFDEGLITRNFYATIAEPNAATLYNVKIDAALSDGEIQIILNVDDGFETIEVFPTMSVTFSGPGGIEQIPGGAMVESIGPDNNGFGDVGGTTWQLSDVWLANSKTVFWGPAPNEVKASMNDDIFDDGVPNEIMDFDAAESDLPNGLMVFTGTTIAPANGGGTETVDLRFEFLVYDGGTIDPRVLVEPATYGLPPSIGGLVELTSISDVVDVKFSLFAKSAGDANFTLTFLQFFDNAPTVDGDQAFSSFTGGFYWSNEDK